MDANAKKVTTLIGDISQSRNIDKKLRPYIQTGLEQLFQKISKQHKGKILSPLMLTLGDEFQGVLISPMAAFDIIQDIEVGARGLGITLRYAVACDVLHTPINKKEPLRMDGPAFWMSRALIEKKTLKYSFYLKEFKFNETLNVLLEVQDDIEHSWSENQRSHIQTLQQNPSLSYVEFAEMKHKNVSTISRSLKSAKYELYQKVIREICVLLEGYK